MPSSSKKQHNLMAMVAHDPKAAKRVGISQSVGKEFSKVNNNFHIHYDSDSIPIYGIDKIAVKIVIPAEGPSLGIAPAGTWICKSQLVNCLSSIPNSLACARA